jgi:hypothetical protein
MGDPKLYENTNDVLKWWKYKLWYEKKRETKQSIIDKIKNMKIPKFTKEQLKIEELKARAEDMREDGCYRLALIFENWANILNKKYENN